MPFTTIQLAEIKAVHGDHYKTAGSILFEDGCTLVDRGSGNPTLLPPSADPRRAAEQRRRFFRLRLSRTEHYITHLDGALRGELGDFTWPTDSTYYGPAPRTGEEALALLKSLAEKDREAVETLTEFIGPPVVVV